MDGSRRRGSAGHRGRDALINASLHTGQAGDVVPAMSRPHCLIQHIICTQAKVNETEITH